MGDSIPDVERLKAISRLFGRSTDELLDNERVGASVGEGGCVNIAANRLFGDSCSTPQAGNSSVSLNRVERLIKKKGYKFGYLLIGWGLVVLLIFAGFAYIFQGHLNAARGLAEGFEDMMPGFNLKLNPETKGLSPYDNALRLMSLAPYLILIVPVAMIILGVVIVAKGKKYGEGIE